LGVLAFGAAGAIWLLLPFWDKPSRKHAEAVVTGVGIFALAYIAVFTVYGYVAK
jgi:quinol-cytochrome oxidoreductase complex cytochrome b subunit